MIRKRETCKFQGFLDYVIFDHSCPLFNQPLSQLASQSVKQPANQSNSQSISQSASQSVDDIVCQSIFLHMCKIAVSYVHLSFLSSAARGNITATAGKRPVVGVERIWAFPGAWIPSLFELNRGLSTKTYCCATLLLKIVRRFWR